MPRSRRQSYADVVYHVINRANARDQIFHAPADYTAFETVLLQAKRRVDVRVLAYCVMPNHWHLVLQPRVDDQLPAFMRWLTMTHTQRWHGFHGTVGSGHLYQGRYKSFPVETGSHFLAVCRYVERNAMRAGLVVRAEHWRHGSLWRRQAGETAWLDGWPVTRPADWLRCVNEVEGEAELEAIRRSVAEERPFGSSGWIVRLAGRGQEPRSTRTR
jgi:putative transposase